MVEGVRSHGSLLDARRFIWTHRPTRAVVWSAYHIVGFANLPEGPIVKPDSRALENASSDDGGKLGTWFQILLGAVALSLLVGSLTRTLAGSQMTNLQVVMNAQMLRVRRFRELIANVIKQQTLLRRSGYCCLISVTCH